MFYKQPYFIIKRKSDILINIRQVFCQKIWLILLILKGQISRFWPILFPGSGTEIGTGIPGSDSGTGRSRVDHSLPNLKRSEFFEWNKS